MVSEVAAWDNHKSVTYFKKEGSFSVCVHNNNKYNICASFQADAENYYKRNLCLSHLLAWHHHVQQIRKGLVTFIVFILKSACSCSDFKGMCTFSNINNAWFLHAFIYLFKCLNMLLHIHIQSSSGVLWF